MAATGTPTPNIGLRIPLGTDPASVDDINYNSNLIDTKLGAVGNDSVQDQIDALNSNKANKTFVDAEVILGGNDLNNVDLPSLSGKTILSATLVYNDDLYYAVLTDGRQLTVSVRSTGVITVLQKGGTRTTNRTIVVRVHYS